MSCSGKRVDSQVYRQPLETLAFNNATVVNKYLYLYEVEAIKDRPPFSGEWEIEFKPKPPTTYQQSFFDRYDSRYTNGSAAISFHEQEINNYRAQRDNRIAQARAEMDARIAESQTNFAQAQAAFQESFNLYNNQYTSNIILPSNAIDTHTVQVSRAITKRVRMENIINQANIKRRAVFFNKAALYVKRFYDRLYLYHHADTPSAFYSHQESMEKAIIRLQALTVKGY